MFERVPEIVKALRRMDKPDMAYGYNGAYQWNAERIGPDAAILIESLKSELGQLQEFAKAQADGRLVVIPETGIGDLSDGYHTFNELYHHRAVLFSVICNQNPQKAWKSKLHNDGTMYAGMFIVGIDTSYGPATYHYNIEPYWDYFKVQELENAPEWDGHTPDDAINRLWNYGINPAWRAAEKALEGGGQDSQDRINPTA